VAVVGLRAAAPRRGVALPAAVVGRRPVLAARERTADPGDSRPAGPRSLHLHRDPPRGPRRVAVRGAARRCRALARPRRAAPAVLWALRGGGCGALGSRPPPGAPRGLPSARLGRHDTPPPRAARGARPQPT